MFVFFDDKESSYIYKVSNIVTVQYIHDKDFFVIQFNDGTVQEYIYETPAQCLNAFIIVRDQLKGEII